MKVTYTVANEIGAEVRTYRTQSGARKYLINRLGFSHDDANRMVLDAAVVEGYRVDVDGSPESAS